MPQYRMLLVGVSLVASLGTSIPVVAQTAFLPREGFTAAVGGGYLRARFGTQDVYAIGTSDVYQGSTLVATGYAAGPAKVVMPDESGMAPSLQLAYFAHFGDSDWLWGARLWYLDAGARSSVNDVRLPQVGQYTQGNTTTPFLGHALAQSYETSIDHQFALLPFVGRSFGNTTLYLGGGVTYSRIGTKINGLVGFADIGGVPHVDISGPPQDFSASGWTWGGGAMVGATHFFAPPWFVDLSYAYSRTRSKTFRYASDFTNPSGPEGTTTVGTLVGDSSGRVHTQAVIATLGKVF